MQPYIGAIMDVASITEGMMHVEFDYKDKKPSFNDTMSPQPNFEFTDYNQRIVVAVLLSFISIVGVVGNALVLIAVAMSRKLQTSTNAFVASLAMTDFLTCLVLPFQVTAVLSTMGWMLPYILCTIIGGVTILSAIASVITLALIAINRYVIITLERARYARIFSRRNVALMILFAWLFPIMTIIFPQAIGYGQLGYTNKYKMCLMDGDHYYAFIYEFGAAAIQLTCFVVIIICYGLIYRFLRRKMFVFQRQSAKVYFKDRNLNRVGPLIAANAHMEETECHSSEISSDQSMHEYSKTMSLGFSSEGLPKTRRKMPTRREVQITRNLFYVVCAFFICIIPYALTLPVPNSGKVLVYMGILVTGSSVINPIIYGFNHPHFRIVFRRLLRCNLDKIPEPTALARFIQGKT